MARKRKEEEHENHERWLVSYADFITLLFAFFVVMYAVSSVNDGKYRVLSDSLLSAFRNPDKSLNPIQIGKPAKSPMTIAPSMRPPAGVQSERSPDRGDQPYAAGASGKKDDGTKSNDDPGKPGPGSDPASGAGAQPNKDGAGLIPAKLPGSDAVASNNGKLEDIKSIAHKLGISLASLLNKKLIAMHRANQWISLEMKSNILFASGSSRLESQAIPVLEQVADSLRGFDNPIQVEGFTDNRPISTLEFPSNWELSAARAASVVHLFTRLGLRPGRMAAVGYGQYRPVASNATPDGRQKNRRVLIIIAAKKNTGRMIDAERAAQQGTSPSTAQTAGTSTAQSPAPTSGSGAAQGKPQVPQHAPEVASQ